MDEGSHAAAGRGAHRPLAAAAGLALASACLAAVVACSSVPFLVSDPAAPRDRSSRFDRFVAELDLALADTAPWSDRVRRAGDSDEAARVEWSQERRSTVRRQVLDNAILRLEREFPPGRLDPERAVVSRLLLEDLRPTNGAIPPALDAAPPRRLADGASSPWSGLLIEAPSILHREHPRTSAADLVAWAERLEALVEESRAIVARLDANASDASGSGVPGLGVSEAATGDGSRVRRVVLDATLESAVGLQGSAGAGGELDPFLGPLEAAASELTGPDARRFRDASRRATGAALATTYRELSRRIDDVLDAVARSGPSPARGALDGGNRAAWLARLRQAAGNDVLPDDLAAIARSEVDRVAEKMVDVLDLEEPTADSIRAAMRGVRDGTVAVPGSERPLRAPELLWLGVERELDRLVADAPELAVTASEALTFERPRGRWSPFVAGNLVATGEPRARTAVYLTPRADDLTVPRWARDAEAWRYGLPGRGLLDAFRRDATEIPDMLRWTPREVFEEGWALYAVQMAAEEDALDEVDGGFSRLAQELTAHTAVLVDIGLHAEGWSRRQAVDFVLDLTPLPESAAADLVLRCLAHPGRMPLPALGLLRIRKLRSSVEAALGSDFDLAEFHGALLRGGPIPIGDMDARVQRWMTAGAGRDV
ncbi:MAG: DUF885 family protein [Planctomycetota bacterium]